MCVYFLFTYIIIIEEPSLKAPNQQLYDLYKRVIVEKKTFWKVIFYLFSQTKSSGGGGSEIYPSTLTNVC